jgi:hypothetical protein
MLELLNNKMVIFNVSDPQYLYTSKKLELPGNPVPVISSSEYVYLGDQESGLITVDISPVEDAHVVDAKRTPAFTSDICRYSDYIYLTSSVGLMIIDVHTPEEAFTAGFVEGNYKAVDVEGEYAFASDSKKGLQVIDVDPPETSGVYKALGFYSGSDDIAVSSGYAYLAHHNMGLGIVDIDPIDSAYIVNTITPANSANRISVQNGYAYMTGASDYFTVFDIDPPEDAKALKQIDISGNQKELDVQGDYVYVAGGSWEDFNVINISDPPHPFLVRQIELATNSNAVTTDGNYAFVTNISTSSQNDGLQIININPPEQAHLVQTFELKGSPSNIAVSGGYVYVACSWGGLRILKIDPF